MEQSLYEKIGKQEMIIEALRTQLNDLSGLMAKFISGEEKPDDWEIADGQIVRKIAAGSNSGLKSKTRA